MANSAMSEAQNYQSSRREHGWITETELFRVEIGWKKVNLEGDPGVFQNKPAVK